jgi:hypothetical protein
LYSNSQETGIWAWDCVANEPVLVVPSVLALLGDNPMQSEFACHVGLAGKFFCRACMVKGSDALADALLEESMSARSRGAHQDSPADSGGDGESAAEADDASGNTTVTAVDVTERRVESVSAASQKPKSRRKKALETMSNMVTRLKSFVEASPIIKTFTLAVLTCDD